MEKITLNIALGSKYEEARKFARKNADITLEGFLQAYPASFSEEDLPATDYLKLPISCFVLQPIRNISPSKKLRTVGGVGRKLRDDLDALWQKEITDEFQKPLSEQEPTAYSEKLTDDEAVRIAYRHEMDAIADFLRNGLSVLVVCDKILTEYIYEFVIHRARKQVVLDSATAKETREGLGTKLDRAVQGERMDPLANLAGKIRALKLNDVFVLRSLDMLDNPPMTELLYQRTAKGEKPQLLAFLDPSLESKKVLTDRFAVHISLMGLPRHVNLDKKRPVYTVTYLLTQKERACFSDYDAEGLYKNVAGLNAIQFRNAMQYVGAKVEPNTDSVKIYRVIRQFKKSSSDEIEIPNTTFKDIGGYDHIKQQLQRIITLLAGPIKGMDEEQRGQLIPRGFVFHGPPGTGKTLFAKAIANELNATIQMISGPEIMDKYVGQSEDNLRRIFATARRNAPAVVFFDEFDSIASQRSTYADGGARANNAVVAQFLTELDGFRQEQTVLVIGTTNRIDIIDEALLRPSRLRPIEIGLPDYAARQRVANIYAKSFGIEKLLKDVFLLANQYFKDWEKRGAAKTGINLPPQFMEALFEKYPAYKIRNDIEDQRAGFLRDLQNFFKFVSQSQKVIADADHIPTLDRMKERLVELGKGYGLDLSKGDLPNLNTEAAMSQLLPFRTDIRELFELLQTEQKNLGSLSPETFINAVMDLVAEYTENFNNDEIRAIFQEASLEHHIEGQLITPRYLGQKIAMIRKRRDERETVHLQSQRGRR